MDVIEVLSYNHEFSGFSDLSGSETHSRIYGVLGFFLWLLLSACLLWML